MLRIPPQVLKIFHYVYREMFYLLSKQLSIELAQGKEDFFVSDYLLLLLLRVNNTIIIHVVLKGNDYCVIS